MGKKPDYRTPWNHIVTIDGRKMIYEEFMTYIPSSKGEEGHKEKWDNAKNEKAG